MAQHVGLTVIHPGGLSATSELAEASGLREGGHILDLGCGKGTTAIYLARKYGCDVTGVDRPGGSDLEATVWRDANGGVYHSFSLG
jgi:ubiquinone/menaquinone biosynthesis C-methylase UbiE